MSDDNGASKVAYFLAGMGLGAIVALLFAPRSGKETRDYLTQKAEEGRGYVTTKGREIRGQAEAAVDRARDVVAKQKEQLSAALEAGKQAYQEEKGKAK
ncbi:MAG: YtxH domain-containing protein [Terriglobia bacterium]|jgi:gas vesicle protein